MPFAFSLYCTVYPLMFGIEDLNTNVVSFVSRGSITCKNVTPAARYAKGNLFLVQWRIFVWSQDMYENKMTTVIHGIHTAREECVHDLFLIAVEASSLDCDGWKRGEHGSKTKSDWWLTVEINWKLVALLCLSVFHMLLSSWFILRPFFIIKQQKVWRRLSGRKFSVLVLLFALSLSSSLPFRISDRKPSTLKIIFSHT